MFDPSRRTYPDPYVDRWYRLQWAHWLASDRAHKTLVRATRERNMPLRGAALDQLRALSRVLIEWEQPFGDLDRPTGMAVMAQYIKENEK